MQKNNETEYRYFQFPLLLLQNILKNPQIGFNEIIGYSIVNYAIKAIKYDLYDVYRQVMYDYYRNKNKIEISLLNKLDEFVNNGELTLDEDNNGFNSSGEFEGFDEIDKLTNIFNSPQNEQLKQKVILHYQIHCAVNYLKITLGNINTTIKHYNIAMRQIEEHTIKYGNDPQPTIKTDFIFDFRDKKQQNEVERLCGLIAIRSIIGQRKFTATHKSVILMRMIGAKNKKVLNDIISKRKDNKELRMIYDKYCKRYQMDNLLEQLFCRGFIRSKISIGRKIYLSTELDMKELEDLIIKKRKEKNLKKQEAEARKRILTET